MLNGSQFPLDAPWHYYLRHTRHVVFRIKRAYSQDRLAFDESSVHVLAEGVNGEIFNAKTVIMRLGRGVKYDSMLHRQFASVRKSGAYVMSAGKGRCLRQGP